MKGSLQGGDRTSAQFAQLYFYDLELATTLRVARNSDTLQPAVLQRLTDELMAVNPFITIYKTAKEWLDSVEDQQAELRIILNPQLKLIIETGADKRQENLPTSNEVAIIIPDEYDVAGSRDIIFTDNYRHGFSTINPNHAAYMALHYVLLFPYGELGWHWALQLQYIGQQQRTRLSQRCGRTATPSVSLRLV